MGETNPTLKSMCWRMQQLGCGLLGHGEDWWLEELFFSPGVHRFQLIEWFLVKLGFSFPNDVQSAHSQEEAVKDFLRVISALGICQKKDNNLIQGNVTKPEHLRFWKKLIDFLWAKNQILQDGCAENDLEQSSADAPTVPSSRLQRSIEEEYLKSCSYIKSWNGSNTNKHVNLFPVDVRKDIDCILTSTPLDKQSFVLESQSTSTYKDVAEMSSLFKETSCKVADTEFDVFKDHDFSEFNVLAFTNFAEFINISLEFFDSNLKPVLRSSDQNFGHLGLQLSKLHSEQKCIKEHLDNLSLMRASFNWLDTKSKLVSNFPAYSSSQPESTLDEYCQIMKSDKEEF